MVLAGNVTYLQWQLSANTLDQDGFGPEDVEIATQPEEGVTLALTAAAASVITDVLLVAHLVPTR